MSGEWRDACAHTRTYLIHNSRAIHQSISAGGASVRGEVILHKHISDSSTHNGGAVIKSVIPIGEGGEAKGEEGLVSRGERRSERETHTYTLMHTQSTHIFVHGCASAQVG